MSANTGKGMKGKPRPAGEHRNVKRPQLASKRILKPVGYGPCAKQSYRDKGAAKVALKMAQGRRRREGTAEVKCEQSVYRCWECGFWHLTSWRKLSGAASRKLHARQRAQGAGDDA